MEVPKKKKNPNSLGKNEFKSGATVYKKSFEYEIFYYLPGSLKNQT